MKVQLTENIKGDEYKQIKGLFYETDGGVLIMEDDFDFSSYGMYASQSLLILENKKSNLAGKSKLCWTIGEVSGNENNELE